MEVYVWLQIAQVPADTDYEFNPDVDSQDSAGCARYVRDMYANDIRNSQTGQAEFQIRKFLQSRPDVDTSLQEM